MFCRAMDSRRSVMEGRDETEREGRKERGNVDITYRDYVIKLLPDVPTVYRHDMPALTRMIKLISVYIQLCFSV